MNKKTLITLADIKRVLNTEMPRLRAKYSVESLEIFGSYVRGEQDVDSDVDILINYIKTPGYFELIGLENHLSELLGVRVDLGTKASLKPRIKSRVLSEAVTI